MYYRYYMTERRGLNLPKSLMDEDDELVSKEARGHMSRASLVSDAVRRYVDELRKEQRAEA
jgi:metal-responsive CopG/Arc/MetJ family transcriptional regulator